MTIICQGHENEDLVVNMYVYISSVTLLIAFKLTVSPGLFLEMALKHIAGGVISQTNSTLVFFGSGAHNIITTH